MGLSMETPFGQILSVALAILRVLSDGFLTENERVVAWRSNLPCWVLLWLFLKKQGLLKIKEWMGEGCEENTS